MKRFINVKPECFECRGELAIDHFQVDLPNCTYIFFCECILCGEENIIILGLDDFIDLSQQLFNPEPPNLLGEGGSNGN